VSWPKEDMFAITSDGKVLLNARAFEGTDVRKLVGKKGVFVGIPLTKREVKLLGEHGYDVCADVASQIVGRRRSFRHRRKA
jgi:hypothetical protein